MHWPGTRTSLGLSPPLARGVRPVRGRHCLAISIHSVLKPSACIFENAHHLTAYVVSRYAILKDPLNAVLAANGVAVLNVSRSSIAEAHRLYDVVADVFVLNVTSSEDTLRARLTQRGRESEADIERRVARAVQDVPTGPNVVTIRNEGTIDEGCQLMTAALTHTLRFSLWLLPDPSDPRVAALSALTQTLASETERADPPFPPHITLCPSFTGSQRRAVEVLRLVAGAVREGGAAGGIAVEFDGVSVGRTRHRAVAIEARHSAQLMQANATAASAVGRPSRGAVDPPVYQPHMSLVYGEFDSATLTRLAGEAIADTDGILGTPLSFTRLAVVMTSGRDCACWYQVTEVSL